MKNPFSVFDDLVSGKLDTNLSDSFYKKRFFYRGIDLFLFADFSLTFQNAF